MRNYEINFFIPLPDDPYWRKPGADRIFTIKYYFEGNLAGAVKKAKEISFRKYQGRFSWWVKRKGDKKISASGMNSRKPDKVNKNF